MRDSFRNKKTSIMKKLFFIAMIIASVGAKAQTPTLCNGIIPILMGDSVIFDLPEHPFDITLHDRLPSGGITRFHQYYAVIRLPASCLPSSLSQL